MASKTQPQKSEADHASSQSLDTAQKNTVSKKKNTAKKTAVKKTAAKKKNTKKTGTEKSGTKKTVTKKSSSEKNTAKKSTAKKTSAKKTATRKTAGASAAGKTLIVVESPTKAKTLSKILGSRYIVKASIGHIVDLPKSRMGIDVENNFEPEYILVRGKAPVKKELQAAAKKAKKIFLAADPDREGEAIAWHVAGLLDVDPGSDCRIRFHEITADAVKGAIKAPSSIDMDRVNAQQARRVLDRLVGYTLSPLLWQKIRRGLSAGRVQSVALAILCARDDEIEAFVPKDYWNIFVDAASSDGRKYRLHVERENGESLIKEGKTLGIDTPEKVAAIENALHSEPLTVSSFTTKKTSRKQPTPFKTSTLQQMAASRLGFSPRRTMRIAQSLFEGVTVPGRGTVGLITYMRTDSLRMAPEAIAQARGEIAGMWGADYLPAKAVVYQAGSKAQDAHEAIRPTDFSLTPEALKTVLQPDQFKLYDLIWRRSIASQMSCAVVESATLECACAAYGLRAQGSEICFDGWGAVWGLDVKSAMLEKAEKGEELSVSALDTQKEQTRPPALYTESSLIKTLEDDGIGRPSTYATIVETLYDRHYVEREQGRKVKPTELGHTVNKFLLEYFSENSPSPIVDVNFTSSMEESLDEVESGQKDWVELIRTFWTPFTEGIAEAEKAPAIPPPPPELIGENCPECGEPLVKKQGRFGPFIGCSGFPECHYIRAIQKKIGVPCPKCGKEHGGEVIQRRSRKGRTFYGCSRYPDCDYVSWNKPAKVMCPVCGTRMEYAARARTPKCPKCGHKGEK